MSKPQEAQRTRNRVAADEAVAAAEAVMREGGRDFGLYTDSDSVPGFVIVAIAVRGKAAGAMVVPRGDYDGFKVLEAVAARPAQSSGDAS